MEQNDMVRVLVVQGYCLLRGALVDRLRQEKWIDVCAIASGMDGLREMIELHTPDALVINVSLKCSAGVLSLKQLKRDYYWLSIVALSCDSEFEDVYIGQILRAGADAYVSSGDSLEDLIRAIRSAGGRKAYVGKFSKRYRPGREEESLLVQLSRREAEVFYLTGCGHVPKRIAELMGVSVKTVESYRERIRSKLGFGKGGDLQYAATSFMRSAARRGIEGSTEEVVTTLLSATG